MEEHLNIREVTERLFALYADDIYRYALYMLHDADDAKDAVQEVFLRVVKSYAKFRSESSLKTWLWSITRNCIADAGRRRSRQRRLPHFYSKESQSSGDPAVAFVEMEELIHALPPRQKQVAILRLIQDLSTTETARILNWSEGKVRSTLHRAVTTLRAQIARTTD